MSEPTLTICCALNCQRPRARPGATHCRKHEVTWHEIQRDQRAIKARGTPVLSHEWADLRERRRAMGMAWPPRNMTL